jgi:hypothetical protein
MHAYRKLTEKSYPPLISSIPWRSDRTHGCAFTDTQSLIATEPSHEYQTPDEIYYATNAGEPLAIAA